MMLTEHKRKGDVMSLAKAVFAARAPHFKTIGAPVPDPGIDLKRKPYLVPVVPAEPPVAEVVPLEIPAFLPAREHTRRSGDPEAPAFQIGAPRVFQIQRATAAHFGLSHRELLNHRHYPRLVWPRHVAIYLACMVCKLGGPETGRRFAGRDHTTILHARRRVEARIAEPEVRAALTAIVERLRNDGFVIAPLPFEVTT